LCISTDTIFRARTPGSGSVEAVMRKRKLHRLNPRTMTAADPAQFYKALTGKEATL
jgi:hypothetical protein